MTSDITYSSLVERYSRARYCMSKKTRSITRSSTLIHVFNTRQAEYSNSLLKLCPRLFPSLPLYSAHPSSLRSIIVEHRSRWARYINVLLYRALEIPNSFHRVSRYFPPRFSLPHSSFLSFVPVQNLIPSSLKGLISPLLLVLFPRHPLKQAKTAPDATDIREEADTSESMELIYPRNHYTRVRQRRR